MPFRRQYLFLGALGLACYAWVLMRYFRHWAVFGVQRVDSAHTDIPETVAVRTQLINDIRFAIRLASRYVPFENVCRHQAYQAKLLCRLHRIPYRIYVGFKKGQHGKIDGHAWTIVQGIPLTGQCNPDEYVVQAVYS